MLVKKQFSHQGVTGLQFGKKLIGQPKMLVHVYFIDGLLIDTGQSRMRKHVLATTKNLDVQQIFITHHHEDHTGNIHSLSDYHQVQVNASSDCCQIMKNPSELSFVQKVTWGKRPAFTNLIAKDDFIETDHHTFEIIPIPGHAVDMVALYEPTKKWLFSADLFIHSYISYFLENESVLQQIESIKKILSLEFDALFCSHNPQLKNPKIKLEKKLRFLETFYHEVEREYNKGLNDKAIFNELHFQENWMVKIFSGGALSKMNMVKSAIRDLAD